MCNDTLSRDAQDEVEILEVEHKLVDHIAYHTMIPSLVDTYNNSRLTKSHIPSTE